MAKQPRDEPITRQQLADSFREARGEVESRVQSAAPKLLPIVAAAGLLVLVLAYLAGRRVGITKSTVVEIRRI